MAGIDTKYNSSPRTYDESGEKLPQSFGSTGAFTPDNIDDVFAFFIASRESRATAPVFEPISDIDFRLRDTVELIRYAVESIGCSLDKPSFQALIARLAASEFPVFSAFSVVTSGNRPVLEQVFRVIANGRNSFCSESGSLELRSIIASGLESDFVEFVCLQIDRRGDDDPVCLEPVVARIPELSTTLSAVGFEKLMTYIDANAPGLWINDPKLLTAETADRLKPTLDAFEFRPRRVLDRVASVLPIEMAQPVRRAVTDYVTRHFSLDSGLAVDYPEVFREFVEVSLDVFLHDKLLEPFPHNLVLALRHSSEAVLTSPTTKLFHEVSGNVHCISFNDFPAEEMVTSGVVGALFDRSGIMLKRLITEAESSPIMSHLKAAFPDLTRSWRGLITSDSPDELFDRLGPLNRVGLMRMVLLASDDVFAPLLSRELDSFDRSTMEKVGDLHIAAQFLGLPTPRQSSTALEYLGGLKSLVSTALRVELKLSCDELRPRELLICASALHAHERLQRFSAAFEPPNSVVPELAEAVLRRWDAPILPSDVSVLCSSHCRKLLVQEALQTFLNHVPKNIFDIPTRELERRLADIEKTSVTSGSTSGPDTGNGSSKEVSKVKAYLCLKQLRRSGVPNELEAKMKLGTSRVSTSEAIDLLRGEFPEFSHDIENIRVPPSQTISGTIHDNSSLQCRAITCEQPSPTCLHPGSGDLKAVALLDELKSPFCRVISLSHSSGVLMARAKIRVCFQSSGAPALYLEPIYPKSSDRTVTERIVAFAGQKAAFVGLPLFGSKQYAGMATEMGPSLVLCSGTNGGFIHTDADDALWQGAAVILESCRLG